MNEAELIDAIDEYTEWRNARAVSGLATDPTTWLAERKRAKAEENLQAMAANVREAAAAVDVALRWQDPAAVARALTSAQNHLVTALSFA